MVLKMSKMGRKWPKFSILHSFSYCEKVKISVSFQALHSDAIKKLLEQKFLCNKVHEIVDWVGL